MAVTRDDVRNIASLARVSVAPDRVDALVTELNGILIHMDALSRVPTTAEPESKVRGMVLAADQGPSVTITRSPAAFAPEWRDGFFLVPRLATHSDAASEDGAS